MLRHLGQVGVIMGNGTSYDSARSVIIYSVEITPLSTAPEKVRIATEACTILMYTCCRNIEFKNRPTHDFHDLNRHEVGFVIALKSTVSGNALSNSIIRNAARPSKFPRLNLYKLVKNLAAFL